MILSLTVLLVIGVAGTGSAESDFRFIPNDTLYSLQWPLTLIHAPDAWDYSRGSDAVIIGVVDTGIDTTHPDLRGNLWVNPGEDLNHNGVIDIAEWNGVDDDGNGFIDDFLGWNFAQGNNNVQDITGHGSYFAGVADAITNNIAGIASLGCKAKIMTAKCGDYSIINAYQAIPYLVDNGARILFMSYGSTIFNPIENAAIAYAWSHGATIIASAGSNGTSTPIYPAAYSNVIAVGASDQNDHLMSFTGWGSWVDVYSPPGNWGPLSGGGWTSMTGTSFSCAMTAGLAALMLARQPTLTNAELPQRLINTCAEIDSLNPGRTGLRRIDAGAALAGLVLQTTITPVNPPIIIPASGGSFTYNAAASNADTIPRSTSFWCKVRMPSGAWYGPVVGPAGLTLPPGGSLTRTRTQAVPGAAPAGNYLFVAFLGEYPGSICSRDTIPFVKQGARGGDEGFDPSQIQGGDDGLRWDDPRSTQAMADGQISGFTLLAASPNPFNASTVVRYKMQDTRQVSLKVYDTAGRLAATLVDGWRDAGTHQVAFDGSNLASGVYLYSLTAGPHHATGKIVLMK
jgi:hypothetical protein